MPLRMQISLWEWMLGKMGNKNENGEETAQKNRTGDECLFVTFTGERQEDSGQRGKRANVFLHFCLSSGKERERERPGSQRSVKTEMDIFSSQ